MRPGPLHRTARGSLAAILLALVAGTAVADDDAAAPARPRDQLLFTGQVWDMSTGSTGGEVQFDWVHPFSTRSSMLVGVVHNTLADVTWTWGRLGGAWRVGRWTGLHAEANVGGGSGVVSGFGYRIYRAGVTQTLVRNKLLADIEDQWVEIGPMWGNILKIGLIVPTGGVGDVSIAYYGSTSGNLESRAATARVLMRHGRLTFLGGIGVGEAAAFATQLVPGLSMYSTDEIYFGVRFPAGSYEMTVILDSLEAGEARRNSLVIGLKIPL